MEPFSTKNTINGTEQDGIFLTKNTKNGTERNVDEMIGKKTNKDGTI